MTTPEPTPEWLEKWQLQLYQMMSNIACVHPNVLNEKRRMTRFLTAIHAEVYAKAQRETDVAICNDLARHGFCGAFQEGGAEACRRVYGAPLAEFEEEVR